MKKLNNEIFQFFQSLGFVIVSTIDSDGFPHNSCKGVVKISKEGRIYLLDLYKARTYENLRLNPKISITAVDEHKFQGYCLKGKAQIVSAGALSSQVITAWEEKLTGRITKRMIRNIRQEQSITSHSEALLPRPEYMIIMEVEDIVDLNP
jgi:uncharacterized pyridoxamine 5'-phosphate oxidase family protein